jgi:hypothetical protein
MTETLFESELFGYEKGRLHRCHPPQDRDWSRRPVAARSFLDEIGELPLSLQVKLLRLLETGTYRRVGGLDWLPADFRLIAATHRDLRAMVQAEVFRRDLYSGSTPSRSTSRPCMSGPATFRCLPSRCSSGSTEKKGAASARARLSGSAAAASVATSANCAI